MSFICRRVATAAEGSGKEGETDVFEMTAIPRNGSRRTRQSLQAIKAEFVGIVEACGYAILPGRLDRQLRELRKHLEPTLFGPAPPAPPAGCTLAAELSAFAPWWDEYVIPCVARGAAGGAATDTNTAAERAIREAVCLAFADILRDNSAFAASDLAVARAWLDGWASDVQLGPSAAGPS